MKICIIGQGYIGLPTAALFARNHCEVVGVDVNEKIIDNLNNGIVHIEEPGISDIIKQSLKNNVYKASLKPEKADAFIIVYSVLDKNSFNNIEKWITEAKNKTSSQHIKFFIIGNNCEEINDRQVGIDEIKQLVEKDNYKFFEISLLNMKEFEDTFNEIFNDIIKTEYSESDYSELSTDDDNKGTKLCCCCRKKCVIF